MSHVSKLAEATRTATNARFATIGRAIADAARSGEPTLELALEVAELRRQEQESAEAGTQFATLARQIGDAAGQGKPYQEPLAKLVRLRKAEIGPGSYAAQVARMSRAR